MQFYQFVLLLAAVYGIWRFVRWMKKPVPRPVSRPDPSRISGYTPGRPGPRPVVPTSTSSHSTVDEDDNFGSSLALGMATGLPIGRNLPAGMLGAMMHEGSHDRDGGQSTERDAHDDRHSHDNNESSSGSYGGSDSGGSSGGDSGGGSSGGGD